MKKLFPHIFYIPIIILIMVLATTKRSEAEMMASLASMNEKLADYSAQDARNQAERAEEYATEARRHERIASETLLKAEEAIANCK
jgi:hypothetical protein